jgi:hypothetical protein
MFHGWISWRNPRTLYYCFALLLIGFGLETSMTSSSSLLFAHLVGLALLLIGFGLGIDFNDIFFLIAFLRPSLPSRPLAFSATFLCRPGRSFLLGIFPAY